VLLARRGLRVPAVRAEGAAAPAGHAKALPPVRVLRPGLQVLQAWLEWQA
jgi:hypothetical protein